MSMEQMQDFFNSSNGQIIFSTIALVLFLVVIAHLYRKKNFTVRNLTFMAISISLALILSNIKVFSYATGGSITACSMFFITIIGYIYGPFYGIITGVAFGLLSFVIEPQFFAPVQVILDYPLAFGFLGLSGFFSNRKYGLYSGYILGCLMRMLASTISGVVFFASYAKDLHPIVYSIGYNASYIIPEMIITLLIISLKPFNKAIGMIKTSAKTAR